MGIKVYDIGNGGNDWSSFLGEALGYYLGNRLNTIQTNRADKKLKESGFSTSITDPTNEEVEQRVKDNLNNNGNYMVGMNAQDAIQNSKKKWGESEALIGKYQNQLDALNKSDPAMKGQIDELAKQINEQRRLQEGYHQNAEMVRDIAKNKGWDLSGYGASDVYKPTAQEQLTNQIAKETAPNYMLDYSDFGLDKTALQQDAKKELMNERKLNQLVNFDKAASMEAVKKAANGIISPYQRQKYIEDKEKEFNELEAQAKRYKYLRAAQRLAPYLAEKDPALAFSMANGMIAEDKTYDSAIFQPKGMTINNGNMNTVTYGGLRPAEHYSIGASPKDLLTYKGKVMDNETSRRNTDVREAGANHRADMASRDKNRSMDIGIADDIITSMQKKLDAGEQLTNDENGLYKAARKQYNDAVGYMDEDDLRKLFRGTAIRQLKNGATKEDILKQAKDGDLNYTDEQIKILEEEIDGILNKS